MEPCEGRAEGLKQQARKLIAALLTEHAERGDYVVVQASGSVQAISDIPAAPMPAIIRSLNIFVDRIYGAAYQDVRVYDKRANLLYKG